MKIFIENYGCTANKNNAEIIAGILSKNHRIVNSEKKADLVVVNTCVVKGPTENKIAKRIIDIKKPVVVAGCMVDARKELINKIRPDALLVSVKNISSIGSVVDKQEIKNKKREIKAKLPKISCNKNVEIIQICEGCPGNCSYCITKIAKGDLFSCPEIDIVDAIKKSNAQEIWLTGQDCGAYGRDLGTNLASLLEKILKLKKDFKIRIGMINPDFAKEMADELIEIYKDDKIKKFIHLPLQSGSNDILEKMNRKYSAEDFIFVVKKFRENFPEIHLKTDVIVGFPTETEKQFEETLDVLKKTKPDSLNISRFWPRPKTAAKAMKQLDDRTIMKRARIIKEFYAELKKKRLSDAVPAYKPL